MNFRGVAQFGSALDWGSRGRRFKSCHSDYKNTPDTCECLGVFFIYVYKHLFA